jgi:hypothetical protein
MKSSLVLAFIILALAFSSCKKCQTCVPHAYSMGVISPIADTKTQSIKLCDKRDINAYESLTNLTDADGDTVRFICQ